MPYFFDHYADLRWPHAAPNVEGLRLPQLGALHAIAAHFTLRTDPALVTMPTGSGKTAVLMAAPFVLRAGRVLVLTPSRLVRAQIAGDFTALTILKKTGVVPRELALPVVLEVDSRIKSQEAWESLSIADVVVGIPSSLSPEIAGIPDPPRGLFDLILVDEAHHSSATTWRGLLDRFPDARRVLFTATPFRRDRGEIVGRFVYTYELGDALRDNVFGRLDYQAVRPDPGDIAGDLSIARRAAAALREDRRQGLDHRIMIRAGTVARAKELTALYATNTDLQLRLITGKHSVRTLNDTIIQLRQGKLDGIVCVDMFGEGFDLPNLKIAALHAPHRSLAITLQFIGRFARTTSSSNLGRAIFFALESEMEIERQRLYEDSAVWENIIPTLSEARIREEQKTREVFQSFRAQAPPKGDEEVSLYAIQPRFHVKIFDASSDFDMTSQSLFSDSVEVAYRWVSKEVNTAVYVTRAATRPSWTTSDRFDGVVYNLTIIHYDAEHRFLFVAATERTPTFYTTVATMLSKSGGILKPVFFGRLNKVLLDIVDARFFNVGMRQTGAAAITESYRTVAGSRADGSIRASDARSFSRGHLAGTGIEHGDSVTIGLSGASKVWSAQTGNIPEFLRWCKRLGAKLRDRRDPKTFSGVDYLSTGVEVGQLPADIAFVDWPSSAYHQGILRIECREGDTVHAIFPLLDLDITIDHNRSDTKSVMLVVPTKFGDWEARFSFQTARFVEPESTNSIVLSIEGHSESIPLEDFLSDEFPVFRTLEFGRLEGWQYLPPSEEVAPFEITQCEEIDWTAEGVNIQRELGPRGSSSIHAYLERRLEASDADIVFYDHGSGEIADFVTIKLSEGDMTIAFYHAKGSSKPHASDRLEDAFEVCGQAIKSSRWVDRGSLLTAVRRRLKRASGESRFIRGDSALLDELLRPSPAVRNSSVEIVIVQPGFSRRKLNGTKIGSLLAAADDYLRGCNGKIKIMASR